MRSLSILLIAMATLTGSQAIAQTVTWRNFLRQQQVGTGVELQSLPVAQNGSQPSLLPLEPEGARFQIWTQKQTAGSPLILLDTKFVNAYQLTSNITVQTGDPYALIPRTRVDQPFTVTVQVAGLQSVAGAETGATQVSFNHTATTYPVDVHVPYAGLPVNTIYTGMLEQNGNHVFNFNGTNLVTSNLATSSGEENFTVSSLAGLGAAGGQLASGRVQIWPLSELSVTGIAGGTTYSTLPEVSFSYKDLYPSSTTWIQVYPGPSSLGTTGTTITSSIITIEDVVPQDRNFILRNWAEMIPTEGQWTLEVLHTTPFGTERLHHVTFNVDMTIEINGQVFSSE